MSTAIEQVQAAVKAQLSSFALATAATREAQDAYTTKREEGFGTRGNILIALAAVAVTGNYSAKDIDDGVDAGVKAYTDGTNFKATTLGTFKSEMKRAMHPNVRKHVPAIFKLARDVFLAEKDLEEVSQPCRREFTREYHLAVRKDGLMGEALTGKTHTIASMQEVARKIIDAKPRDPKLARDAIKRAVKVLQAVYVEFPAPDIEAMIEFAKDLSPDELQKFARVQEPAPKPQLRRRNAPVTPATAAAATEEMLGK